MRWASRNRFAPTAGLVVALLSAGIWIALHAGGGLRALELDTIDVRFSLRGERPVEDVAVVAIDDVTFSELQQQWPFPRSLHARVVDRLRRAGARTIAYDVQFTEPTKPKEDLALFDAVGRTPRVVLATTEVDARGRTNVLGGDANLADVGARAGNAVLNQDKGGVQRRFPYAIDGLKGFAVTAAETSRGAPVDPKLFEGEDAWIDYAGPPGTVPTYSFARVLRGEVGRDALGGRVVVVGPSVPSLQDVHPVPTSSVDLMAGAEVQANAISTVLRGFPLKATDEATSVLLIALLALAGPAAGLRVGTIRMLIGVGALGLLYAAGVLVAFRLELILPLVHPLGALVTAAVGALAIALILGTLERTRVHDAFARFVPKDVVDDVLSKTGDDLRLGGVRRRATVLFSDLRGFTTFSETLPPDLVIHVLNRYLEEMSDAILDNGGTLITYMGDGIMAVFGAPLDQPDHGDRAVAAAREMAGERLARFNRWLRSEGFGDEVAHDFEMGIGVNTGFVMSGNVGSKRRLEYTAIGDTTNTAARLEAMTKDTAHQVFLSESTRACLGAPPADLVPVGELEVRGRRAPVSVWALSALDKRPGTEPAERPAPA